MEPRKLWFRAVGGDEGQFRFDAHCRPGAPIQALDSHSLNSFLYTHDPPYPASLAFPAQATPAFPPTWVYCCTSDTLVPVAQSYLVVDTLSAVGVECVKDELDAPQGSLDLPGRYFAEQAQGWWEEHVEPSLRWAMGKLRPRR